MCFTDVLGVVRCVPRGRPVPDCTQTIHTKETREERARRERGEKRRRRKLGEEERDTKRGCCR